MDAMEVLTIISVVTSIILGIVAIVLSILFYTMTERRSRDSEKSATNIQNNVDKLEALFNKLYTGTFDMMKETYTDIRKYAYNSDEISKKKSVSDDEIIRKTVDKMTKDISDLKINKMDEGKIENLIKKTLYSSAEAKTEIKYKQAKEIILNRLKVKPHTFSELRQILIKLELLGDEDPLLWLIIKELFEEGRINDPYTFDPVEDRPSISYAEEIYLV